MSDDHSGEKLTVTKRCWLSLNYQNFDIQDTMNCDYKLLIFTHALCLSTVQQIRGSWDLSMMKAAP